jgi:hypothetical protein
MYEVRQIIQRLRLGETDRSIARSQRVGRRKVAQIRAMSAEQNWLDAALPIPDDALIAAHYRSSATAVSIATPKAARNTSTVEPYRAEILAWHQQDIPVSAMRQALARKYGYSGSVHALHRLIRRIVPTTPAATVMLDFAVAEQAQIDFGSGPLITDRQTSETFKTWFFVMTLAWSRHQYAEVVRDQSVATWLACHRHAFEWFNGVPRKVRIDNPKCAITKACYYEPTVQRADGAACLRRTGPRLRLHHRSLSGRRSGEEGSRRSRRQIHQGQLRAAARIPQRDASQRTTAGVGAGRGR